MIPHESKNILVLADDRYGVSLTTKYALEDRFNVIRTEDYNNAFERLGSRDIDLFVINSWLPEIGICTDILKKIRMLYPDLPILVIAESQDYEKWHEFIDAGATDVIDILPSGDSLVRVLLEKVSEILIHSRG